jgi:hypothetical protein
VERRWRWWVLVVVGTGIIGFTNTNTNTNTNTITTIAFGHGSYSNYGWRVSTFKVQPAIGSLGLGAWIAVSVSVSASVECEWRYHIHRTGWAGTSTRSRISESYTRIGMVFKLVVGGRREWPGPRYGIERQLQAWKESSF